MRVRHLQTYIQSQRLVGSNKVAVLRGMTVGLDTTAWIRSLLELKDAYSDIMGGLPLGLRAVLDQQLQGFEEAEIFPAFFLQVINRSTGSCMAHCRPSQLNTISDLD